jgi:TetR/AcrR family transcriptional repressor of nem operon
MQDSREHILTTAFQLFLHNSYKEVTMSELVKISGLSKGAFYHYFNSKEQLFEEVINHFYSSLLEEDYSHYSHESLVDFYHDYLAGATQRFNRHPMKVATSSTLRTSHYMLLFDALKRLPAFRALRDKQQELELAAWSAVVQQARDTGEISTQLPTLQVAKMFVYLSDGIAINYMLQNQTDDLLREMATGFDALYQLLKT